MAWALGQQSSPVGGMNRDMDMHRDSASMHRSRLAAFFALNGSGRRRRQLASGGFDPGQGSAPSRYEESRTTLVSPSMIAARRDGLPVTTLEKPRVDSERVRSSFVQDGKSHR